MIVQKDDFRYKLSKFKEKSKEIYELCLLNKSKYLNEFHNNLLDKDGFNVRIYFNDNHKTWALYVGRMEYRAYMEHIDIPSACIHDPKYLEEILMTMETVIEILKEGKRKLNFMEK